MKEQLAPPPSPTDSLAPPVEAAYSWLDFNDGQGGMTMGEYLGVVFDEATGQFVKVPKPHYDS